MSLSKSIGALFATIIVGMFTFLITTPKKMIKNKANDAKTSMQNGIDEKENLFI